MGWISIYTCQKLEVIRLWCRLCNLPAPRLTKHVFQWSFDLAQNRMKNWEYFVLKMYRLNDLDFLNVIQPRFTPAIIRQSFSILKTAENQQWENDLFNDRNLINGNKSRTYRCFKSRLVTEDYVKLNIPRHERRILSMLRCGTLPLHVETGRWCRPVKPLDQRICTYCNQNKIENEVHFIIECDIYDDLRVELFSKYAEFNTDFTDFNANDRFFYNELHTLFICARQACFYYV